MMKIVVIRLFFFLILIFINSSLCFAQTQSKWTSVSRLNAFSINIAGTTPFIGVTYERLLTDKINVEVGLGVYSIGASLKFFPFSIFENKMEPNIEIGSNLFSTPFDTFGSGDFSSTNYLNIGMCYFGKEGFNFSIGIGPSINYDFEFDEVTRSFYGHLKLGYRY